jgi:hypothetical protein
MAKPYLTDATGKHCYDGDRVWITGENDTSVFGTLKLTPTDDEYSVMYKWSVRWDDLGELYWTRPQKLNKEAPPTRS